MLEIFNSKDKLMAEDDLVDILGIATSKLPQLVTKARSIEPIATRDKEYTAQKKAKANDNLEAIMKKVKQYGDDYEGMYNDDFMMLDKISSFFIFDGKYFEYSEIKHLENIKRRLQVHDFLEDIALKIKNLDLAKHNHQVANHISMIIRRAQDALDIIQSNGTPKDVARMESYIADLVNRYNIANNV